MDSVGKRMRSALQIAVLTALVGVASLAAAEDPWADAVVAYAPNDPNPGYDDPSQALGAPLGGGPVVVNNDSVVSLGRPHGRIVLQFDTPITDDPDNPMGLDFIVYSNALWAGGNPQRRWQEPAFVEISRDANGNGLADDPWYMIPGSRGFSYAPDRYPNRVEPNGQTNDPPDGWTEPGEIPDDPNDVSVYRLLMGGNVRNPNITDDDPANDNEEFTWGYAELSPAMPPYRDNYMRPDDPFTVGIDFGTGGGDAFDIAWAIPEEDGLPPLTEFHFIRITSFVSRNTGVVGWVTPEVHAVAAVAPDVDTDGDGILDAYEIRVAGTDPLRPESTVLPLETPALWGGSPEGALLGEAVDASGNRLRLFSSGDRAYEPKPYNVNVDILSPVPPAGDLPSGDLILSGAVRELVSQFGDFDAVQVQPAEFRIAYDAADIVGLDEATLTPYRHSGGVWTSEGITAIERNVAANHVTFRTRYAGIFALAAAAGDGDPDAEGPRGDIPLVANPADEIVVGPASIVTVTGGPVRDGVGDLVEDGARVTVAASNGTVTSPDADASRPGVQVETAGGMFSFDLAAGTVAGPVVFSATSVAGAAYGELDYVYAPGPPAGEIRWMVESTEGDGPATVSLVSLPIRDAYGNVVRDGAALTVVVNGGVIVSDDADPVASGHQALVTGGRLRVFVEAWDPTEAFTIAVYGLGGESDPLGASEITPVEPTPPLPVTGAWALAWILAALGVLATLRRAEYGSRA